MSFEETHLESSGTDDDLVAYSKQMLIAVRLWGFIRVFATFYYSTSMLASSFTPPCCDTGLKESLAGLCGI